MSHFTFILQTTQVVRDHRDSVLHLVIVDRARIRLNVAALAMPFDQCQSCLPLSDLKEKIVYVWG